MTFLVLLVFGALLIPDLPGLVRRRQWAELAAYGTLWTAGLILSLLIAYDVPVNQLTRLLRAVFEPIGTAIIKPPPT